MLYYFMLVFLPLSSQWMPRFIDGIDKELACTCLLKSPSPISTPKSSVKVEFVTSFYERVLSMFRTHPYYGEQSNKGRTAATTTTTVKPTTVLGEEVDEQRFLKQLDDSAMSGALTSLAGKLIERYLYRFRSKWNIFERFSCHCDGKIIDILKARHYIHLRVMHD